MENYIDKNKLTLNEMLQCTICKSDNDNIVCRNR